MSAESFKLTIYSPERKVLDREEVLSLSMNTGEGEIEIYPGHAPLIGKIETGIATFKSKATGERKCFISAGFFEVDFENVILLAEVVEWKSEVDLTRAKMAQKKAEDELKNPALEPENFRKYQLKLQRSLIRQNLSSNS